jgi:hypothetical protein
MDWESQAALDAPHRLSGRVLQDLIAFRLASGKDPNYAIEDAFYDFAEDYFSLSLEDEALLRNPALEESVVDILTRALSDAVESGVLATLRYPARLMGRMASASLGTLRVQVLDGALAPGDAADLFTTLLFEGLNASPTTRV